MTNDPQTNEATIGECYRSFLFDILLNSQFIFIFRAIPIKQLLFVYIFIFNNYKLVGISILKRSTCCIIFGINIDKENKLRNVVVDRE